MAETKTERETIIETLKFLMSNCENGNDCEVCLGLQIAIKVVKGEM